jgi:hypothetical protein
VKGIPFYGRVLPGGLLVMENAKAYGAHVRSLAGKHVEIYVQRRQQKRSHQANRFYWGYVLSEIADAAGYFKDEAHEALKFKFLREDGDGPLVRVKSTSDLSTEEFSLYVEQCMALGAQTYGIVWEPMSTQEGAA